MKKVNKFAVIMLDILEMFIVGLAVFILVYAFVGQLLRITGDSMAPTLHNDEQIIAEKLSGRLRALERGEIVIFRHPERADVPLIKRVIGLPGEKFEIKEGKVFINDLPLNEPYTTEETYGGESIHTDVNIIIPNGEYVLLGDNRSNSSDSRKWGTIKHENILANAFLVYYPIDNVRLIDSKLGVQNAVKLVRDKVNNGNKLSF